ncbi:hypothetical protein VHUM_02762 [Vanrija humicola]|uniref:Cystathionine gamma-synthase n=1 Tax=Vanrija humicola TaxID=5417 RepID=A0A7D8UXZ5_VANHU|nr:hypothetical protein VHUM_02762 [Vanrija humicola]
MSPKDVSSLGLASRSVHADDGLSAHRAIAPAVHVSTTFAYSSDPDALKRWDNTDPAAPHDSHSYSRYTAPNTTRLEAVLASLLGGPALSYGSGLAAFHALLVHLNPKRIAIGEGYHGAFGVIRLLTRLTGLEAVGLDEIDKLGPGDVIHIETPLNPTGEARDLAFYAAKARAAGAYLTVDATFAPPPLLDPFKWGADAVVHSGTKYLGGHSDLLCGVIAVSPEKAGWYEDLKNDRYLLGGVMGSLEGWLGLRSLRTLSLRVKRQSETATALVQWLEAERLNPGSPAAVLTRVQHASLQPEQMPNGYGPVFAIWLQTKDDARRLPSKLGLFHHATSLGGVESLIEWRALSDDKIDERVLRVSIGVEDLEDLKADLLAGFEALRL